MRSITDVERVHALAPMTQFRVSGMRFIRAATVDRAGRVYGMKVSPGHDRGSLVAFAPSTFVEVLGSVQVRAPREFVEEEAVPVPQPQREPPAPPAQRTKPTRLVRSKWDWLHRHFEKADYAVLETPAGEDPNKFRRRVACMIQMSTKNSANLYHWHTHVYGTRILLWRGVLWNGCEGEAARKPAFTWKEITADTKMLLRILSEPVVAEADETKQS